MAHSRIKKLGTEGAAEFVSPAAMPRDPKVSQLRLRDGMESDQVSLLKRRSPSMGPVRLRSHAEKVADLKYRSRIALKDYNNELNNLHNLLIDLQDLEKPSKTLERFDVATHHLIKSSHAIGSFRKKMLENIEERKSILDSHSNTPTRRNPPRGFGEYVKNAKHFLSLNSELIRSDAFAIVDVGLFVESLGCDHSYKNELSDIHQRLLVRLVQRKGFHSLFIEAHRAVKWEEWHSRQKTRPVQNRPALDRVSAAAPAAPAAPADSAAQAAFDDAYDQFDILNALVARSSGVNKGECAGSPAGSQEVKGDDESNAAKAPETTPQKTPAPATPPAETPMVDGEKRSVGRSGNVLKRQDSEAQISDFLSPKETPSQNRSDGSDLMSACTVFGAHAIWGFGQLPSTGSDSPDSLTDDRANSPKTTRSVNRQIRFDGEASF